MLSRKDYDKRKRGFVKTVKNTMPPTATRLSEFPILINEQ